MANEAVIIELGSFGGAPVRRTCLDTTNISKGTLLKLSGANLAIATSGVGEPFAGIAAHDKLAGDGSTSIGCYTWGVFDLKNSTVPITAAGKYVVMSGANIIREALAGDVISGAVVGKIEEYAAANEVVRVRLIGL